MKPNQTGNQQTNSAAYRNNHTAEKIGFYLCIQLGAIPCLSLIHIYVAYSSSCFFSFNCFLISSSEFLLCLYDVLRLMFSFSPISESLISKKKNINTMFRLCSGNCFSASASSSSSTRISVPHLSLIHILVWKGIRSLIHGSASGHRSSILKHMHLTKNCTVYAWILVSAMWKEK